MGKYISLILRFDEPHREVDILRGVLQCTAFKLKAIGALGQTKRDKNDSVAGFLSGWALEPFGRHFRSGLKGRPLTTFPATSGNEPYLATVGAKIRNGSLSATQLSPFEQQDEKYNATFLNAPDLGAESLDACDNWTKQRNWSSVRLDGTFHLSVRDPNASRWANAYQTAYEYPPDCDFTPVFFPFIELWAMTTLDEPDNTFLMLYSASFVWLCEAGDLRGHIGPDEADENLLRFAGLAERLVCNGAVGLRRADLTMAGSLFVNEYKRIIGLLSSAIPSLNVELG